VLKSQRHVRHDAVGRARSTRPARFACPRAWHVACASKLTCLAIPQAEPAQEGKKDKKDKKDKKEKKDKKDKKKEESDSDVEEEKSKKVPAVSWHTHPCVVLLWLLFPLVPREKMRALQWWMYKAVCVRISFMSQETQNWTDRSSRGSRALHTNHHHSISCTHRHVYVRMLVLVTLAQITFLLAAYCQQPCVND
jgi:hypothetical protein